MIAGHRDDSRSMGAERWLHFDFESLANKGPAKRRPIETRNQSHTTR
ncbi:hypothetical protein MPLB_280076 [Mesorhizobium sp. ORS 3324]|nr:hypothetical protein MPLB_280076 [Mesorhizobium sp. ORS 3324]